MLKWDKYNLMTPEHKEEWNYRFKEKIEPKSNSPVTYIMLIVLTFSLSTMIYFLVLKEYVNVALTMQDAFSMSMQTSLFMTAVWALDIVVTNAITLYWYYQSRKWLNDRGYK